MQGTVATFDPASRSGQILTDDGVPLSYAAHTLAEHIRHLRLGQRVFIELAPGVADPVPGAELASVAIWPHQPR